MRARSTLDRSLITRTLWRLLLIASVLAGVMMTARARDTETTDAETLATASAHEPVELNRSTERAPSTPLRFNLAEAATFALYPSAFGRDSIPQPTRVRRNARHTRSAVRVRTSRPFLLAGVLRADSRGALGFCARCGRRRERAPTGPNSSDGETTT